MKNFFRRFNFFFILAIVVCYNNCSGGFKSGQNNSQSSGNLPNNSNSFSSSSLASSSVGAVVAITAPHSFQIQSSGMCWKAQSLPIVPGTQIVQDVCSSTSLVFVESLLGSGLQLQVQNTNFCVNAASTVAADPAGVTLATCNGSASQTYVPSMISGNLRSFNLFNTTLCLDELDNSVTAGTVLGQWTCDGQNPQSHLAIPPTSASASSSSVLSSSSSVSSPSTSSSSTAGASSVVSTSSSVACTKYVSPSGTLGGHSASSTIQSAVKNLVLGDVLCVGPGTYNEQVNVTASGTSNSPITIRAFDSSNHPVVDGAYVIPGGPSFFSSYTYNDSTGAAHSAQCYEYSSNSYGQPVNANANQGPFPMVACQAPNSVNNQPNNNVLVTIQGNYVTWDGIDITRSRGVGLVLGNGSGFGMYVVNGANGTWYNNINFLNSVVSHIRSAGVVTLLVDTLKFSGNSITDVGNFADYDHSVQDYGGNNYHVWGWPNALNATGKNLTFTNNYIYETFTEGIQIGAFVLNPAGVQYPQGAWNSAQNIIFSHNVVYDTWSANVYIGNFTGAVVDSNIIYNTGNPKYIHADTGTPGDCASITSESGSFSNPTNLTFTNNIITGCGNLFDLLECNQCDSSVVPLYSNITVANNTLMNPYQGGGVLLNTMTKLSGFTFVNNLIYSPNNPIFNPWFGYNTLPSGSVYGNNLWSSTPTNSGSHAGNGSPQQSNLTGSGDVISNSPGLANPSYKSVEGTAFDASVIKLSTTSPAIGKGRSLSSVTTDYFGTSRVGAPNEIGAFQGP